MSFMRVVQQYAYTLSLLTLLNRILHSTQTHILPSICTASGPDRLLPSWERWRTGYVGLGPKAWGIAVCRRCRLGGQTGSKGKGFTTTSDAYLREKTNTTQYSSYPRPFLTGTELIFEGQILPVNWNSAPSCYWP